MKTPAPVLAPALVLALALVAAPAAATTFVMVSDEALVDRTPVVVEARVLSADDSPAPGAPSTDYLIEVERLVKGSVPGSNLIVRVPGGVGPDGIGLKVWGAPEFALGERVLLFLRPHDDGTFRVAKLMLGVFHEVRVGGSTVLVRNLAEAHEVAAPGEDDGARDRWRRPREREAFLEWIDQRAKGVAAAGEYFYTPPAGQPTPVYQPFTLFESGGLNLRWFIFDAPFGQTARWRVNQNGQPGLTLDQTLDAVGEAMATWTNEPGSDVFYGFGSPQTTSTTNNLGDGEFDDLNSVQFGDPTNNPDFDEPFDCASGGILAIGGPWFQNAPRSWEGQQYRPIVGADIVTNANLECFFNNSSNRQRLAAQLFAHEFGHTLGLGHSCGDSNSPSCGSSPALNDALMRATIHATSRGPGLGSDDVAGIRRLYDNGQGGPGPGDPPAAPTNLAAQLTNASTAVLTWNDNSNNENGFRIQQRIGSGGFANLIDLPANAATATISGLSPQTTYTWRVRAQGSSGNSGFSNEASVTTPSPLPAAPSHLTAVRISPTIILLEWDDNSVNETGFAIERSSPVEAFHEIDVTGPGATSYSAGALVSGRPYTFRVRARNNGGASGYSNEASATTVVAPTAACVADGDTLCLLSGRFRVEVQWRNQFAGGNNGLGAVQASPVGGSKTGVFSFFNAANIELIVKALDGTTLPNPAYWFFYGALSTVEYWITVTDTQTGAIKTYHNPPNELCGLPDTSAFPVGSPVASSSAVRRPAPGARSASSALRVASRPGLSGTCAPSANTLCLAEGRFAVTVDWTNPRTLNSGDGTAVPGSDKTGYFWFFNAENIELVVKILDNTATPADNWWIFYGALSDVEYNIRVLDTVTGLEKSYNNEPLNFCGDADTDGLPDSL